MMVRCGTLAVSPCPHPKLGSAQPPGCVRAPRSDGTRPGPLLSRRRRSTLPGHHREAFARYYVIEEGDGRAYLQLQNRGPDALWARPPASPLSPCRSRTDYQSCACVPSPFPPPSPEYSCLACLSRSRRCQRGSRTVSAAVIRNGFRFAHDLAPGTNAITSDRQTPCRSIAKTPLRCPTVVWPGRACTWTSGC